MLDAYIIERIRRERERERERSRPVLHVPKPEPPRAPEERYREKRDERGIAIIDFDL